MKTKKISSWKRGLAICMMFIMAFMLPATSLQQTVSQAAEKTHNPYYIKDVKLFIKKQGKLDDAEKWCKEQDGDWKVFNGDLNDSASGAFTKDVAVFLCYEPTVDPDEAITDLAVMNEKGDYSESEYELLLKKQKDSYIDMVKNMKGMINEYRANYEKKTPMAVQSYNYLNAYKDDDTGELLGDILLNADDDRIASIMLQCNGMVVLAMQEKLAAACDTAKTTWLDRMVKLGSYDKLKDAFSRNLSGGNIEKEIEKQYKETAIKILDRWDDLYATIENMSKFISENNLTGASKEQVDEWAKKLDPADSAFTSYEQFMTLFGLSAYKYGDKTLLDFFSKTKRQVEMDGIETLYPMAACLSKGQICALSESVSIFQMIQEAMGASVLNDTNTGVMADIKSDKEGKQILSDSKETIDDVDKMISLLGDKKISIYEGVDRDVYKGGVAVTTDAKQASAGDENSWTSLFVDKGNVSLTSIGVGIGAITTGILAFVFSHAAKAVENASYVKSFKQIYSVDDSLLYQVFDASTITKIRNNRITEITQLESLAMTDDDAVFALTDLTGKAIGQKSYKTFSLLKKGMTGFMILLSIADIAITAYSLYKYYNVEHLPIPHHMVDMTYSETKEASYVAYKSVRDQDGNCGDLNGGNSRQWLALYYTKDKKAGTPILAPSGGDEYRCIYGSSKSPGSEYSPIHMFGTRNVAQNLTFADGENGYSFNDGRGGIYFYYMHAGDVKMFGADDADASKDDEKESVSVATDVDTTQTEEAQATAGSEQAGTALSGGVVALIGVGGLVAGCFIGGIVVGVRRKKKI